jgi:hypothetical protein
MWKFFKNLYRGYMRCPLPLSPLCASMMGEEVGTSCTLKNFCKISFLIKYKKNSSLRDLGNPPLLMFSQPHGKKRNIDYTGGVRWEGKYSTPLRQISKHLLIKMQ